MSATNQIHCARCGYPPADVEPGTYALHYCVKDEWLCETCYRAVYVTTERRWAVKVSELEEQVKVARALINDLMAALEPFAAAANREDEWAKRESGEASTVHFRLWTSFEKVSAARAALERAKGERE